MKPRKFFFAAIAEVLLTQLLEGVVVVGGFGVWLWGFVFCFARGVAH
jgi:hypothetical protein